MKELAFPPFIEDRKGNQGWRVAGQCQMAGFFFSGKNPFLSILIILY